MPDENAERDANHKLVELNRRKFFIKLGAGSLAIAGVGAASFAAQYLSPNVLYESVSTKF